MKKTDEKVIAYFSMEFAISDAIPNFSGGLGVLAGDLLFSGADLGLDMVGVTLLYHQNDKAEKSFKPTMMKKLSQTVTVEIAGRAVRVAIWEYRVKSSGGKQALIYFLDTFLPDNARQDRELTREIYLHGQEARLGQEMLLGIGGVKVLQVLGYEVNNYHLNEGHCSASILEKIAEHSGDVEKTKALFTFTTHTPVGSGHDYFSYDVAMRLLGGLLPASIRDLLRGDALGMTQLALAFSRKTNSVSLKHNEVCQKMFPDNSFENITNGIYHPRWVGKKMKKLFDTYIEGWSVNPVMFKNASDLLPDLALQKARRAEKMNLIEWVNTDTKNFPLTKLTESDLLDENILTIGFARRIVPYKRWDLIFRNMGELLTIGNGKIQIVFAGSPRTDDYYKSIVKSLQKNARDLRGKIKIAFINEYNLDIAKRLVTGVDIWLNTPIVGNEASGTSGMKAALNGAVNISSLDGWWLEAIKMDALSGWGFGGVNGDEIDNQELLIALKEAVDCYYNRPDEWLKRVKHSIGLLGYFNTHRAVLEYKEKMWS